MDEENRRSGHKLQQKIPVAHGVDAILRDPGKSQEFCHIAPIDRKRRAGQRAGAQGQDVDAFEACRKALAVALEHVVISQKMMRQQHRLSALEMGIARHDDIKMFSCRPCQLALQRPQSVDDDLHFFAQIEPHVQRNLIVAAPRRMQFSSRGTDQLGQAPLDIHVNILVGLRKLKLAALDLALDILQPADDLAAFARRYDALLGQHLRVRDAAHDVVAV